MNAAKMPKFDAIVANRCIFPHKARITLNHRTIRPADGPDGAWSTAESHGFWPIVAI